MGKIKTLTLDASALLAISFKEANYERVAELMDASDRLIMSAVTVAEVVIQLLHRLPKSAESFQSEMRAFGVEFLPVEVEHAVIAAAARLRYPLNFGDCFVYALAKVERSTILTLDEDFKGCDVPLLFPQ